MKQEKYYLKDKLFYLSIIIFGIYLLIRLFDEAKLIHTFPLDWANDISSYIAQLHFLKVCGFHNFCQYWYNGYIAFLFTPPAWYFFTLPLYLLLGNILLSTYISVILMYVLGLVAFLLMGKLNNFSYVKAIGLFFLFFVNPDSIGELLRLGRVTTFFAWVIFLFIFSIILYYKDKPLNKYFLFFIPLYSILILSHLQELTLFSFILLGFFLAKNNKEKLFLLGSCAISILLVSFWLVPFILNVKNSGLMVYPLSNWLLSFKGNLLWTNLLSMGIVLVFSALFYLYWKQNNKSRKDLLFFFPSLILGFFLFTRLVVFIPVLKNIAPDPYIFYFTLLSLYLFVKIKYDKTILKVINALFVILVFISLLISIFYTPWFTEHTQLEKDTLFLIKENVKGNYLIFGVYPTSYSPAYYSYTPIFYNLSTASGWYPHASTKDYVTSLFELNNYFDEGNCEKVRSYLQRFNVTQVLGYGDTCEQIKKCSFEYLDSRERVCVYNV